VHMDGSSFSFPSNLRMFYGSLIGMAIHKGSSRMGSLLKCNATNMAILMSQRKKKTYEKMNIGRKMKHLETQMNLEVPPCFCFQWDFTF
jgi:hypothetical protein